MEPVCCSMSSSNCCFLTGFSRGRSGGLVFPSLSEFSTVYCDPHSKGFGIVNKAEIDVFLELSCFFDDPAQPCLFPSPQPPWMGPRQLKDWLVRGRSWARAQKSYLPIFHVTKPISFLFVFYFIFSIFWSLHYNRKRKWLEEKRVKTIWLRIF